VLLLDEPFGALDARVRKDLRRWLRRLHDELHVTSVFVTHDQEEALEVADRVVIMNHGRVEQIGAPDEIYANPVNAFVYSFLWEVNVFRARSGGAVTYFRPHDLQLARDPGGAFASGRVTRVMPSGPVVRVLLEREDTGADGHHEVSVDLSHESFTSLSPREGERLWIRSRTAQIFVAGEGI